MREFQPHAMAELPEQGGDSAVWCRSMVLVRFGRWTAAVATALEWTIQDGAWPCVADTSIEAGGAMILSIDVSDPSRSSYVS